mmetsp:Transcript_29640/g.80120  ORF Transcript_29640/g.80120 Transcript_29640/m.80120 type:complete len:218 (-) Transcript_29640:12-665(-)
MLDNGRLWVASRHGWGRWQGQPGRRRQEVGEAQQRRGSACWWRPQRRRARSGAAGQAASDVGRAAVHGPGRGAARRHQGRAQAVLGERRVLRGEVRGHRFGWRLHGERLRGRPKVDERVFHLELEALVIAPLTDRGQRAAAPRKLRSRCRLLRRVHHLDVRRRDGRWRAVLPARNEECHLALLRTPRRRALHRGGATAAASGSSHELHPDRGRGCPA